MDLSSIIQFLAILIECAIVVIAVVIAVRNQKKYGWFIAVTFALFALFDVLRIFPVPGLLDFHSLLLFIACISMLYAVWLVYDDTTGEGY